MSFIRDAEDALLILLDNELNIPVILDYSNGPEPVGDYGVIGLSATDKLHRNQLAYRETSDSFKEVIRQQYLLRFTFRFYGETCYENAFESQAILASRAVQETLYETAKLSYADIENIRRTPERRQTGYIQRAIYDVKFLSTFESVKDADWFEDVKYTTEYINADSS